MFVRRCLFLVLMMVRVEALHFKLEDMELRDHAQCQTSQCRMIQTVHCYLHLYSGLGSYRSVAFISGWGRIFLRTMFHFLP